MCTNAYTFLQTRAYIVKICSNFYDNIPGPSWQRGPARFSVPPFSRPRSAFCSAHSGLSTPAERARERIKRVKVAGTHSVVNAVEGWPTL